ncbi:MAG: squalene synthase HpnC [bacterium]
MSKDGNSNLEKGFVDAIAFASSHYENFPVVSLFIQKRLRKHVAVIYRFARQADDIADEGDLAPTERINLLSNYLQTFEEMLKGNFENDFWFALFSTINEFHLKHENFRNLISAFNQDIIKKRYDSYEELTDYCRRSANPIGRLILELHGIKEERILNLSDAICTGLQLTNFYQDTSIDFRNGRIYFPIDELQKFNVHENTFELSENNINFTRLMEYQVHRNFELYTKGKEIIKYLPPRLARQISWTIAGGEMILNKIINSNYDVLNKRPVISKTEFFLMMIKNIF